MFGGGRIFYASRATKYRGIDVMQEFWGLIYNIAMTIFASYCFVGMYLGMSGRFKRNPFSRGLSTYIWFSGILLFLGFLLNWETVPIVEKSVLASGVGWLVGGLLHTYHHTTIPEIQEKLDRDERATIDDLVSSQTACICGTTCAIVTAVGLIMTAATT